MLIHYLLTFSECFANLNSNCDSEITNELIDTQSRPKCDACVQKEQADLEALQS